LPFSLDTDTGLYRIGANNPALVAGGAKLADWKSAGNTQPLQPAFSAYLSSNQANATGDGSAFVVPLDGEWGDQGNNFAASTFTAPVNGMYLLAGSVRLSNIAAGHNAFTVYISTSVRNYLLAKGSAAAEMDATNNIQVAASIVAKMVAGETATLNVLV